MNKLAAAILLILALLTGLVIGTTIQEYIIQIQNTGNIKGVGVSIYWRNGTEVNSINWGLIDNNTEYTLEPFIITNTNNTDCTLSLATENYSLNLLSLSLTWNYSGSPLQPQAWQIIALTLNASAINYEPFMFDIVIKATEVT